MFTEFANTGIKVVSFDQRGFGHTVRLNGTHGHNEGIETTMNDIELLKKLPKEHYTEHGGKAILVKNLIKILDEEAEDIERKRKAVSKRKKKEKQEDDL